MRLATAFRTVVALVDQKMAAADPVAEKYAEWELIFTNEATEKADF